MEFCWGRVRPSHGVAFSPRPKNNRPLCLRDAAPPPTCEPVRRCRRRRARMCTAHPGGEPRSAGRRGSCLGPHLHLPALRLGSCWPRSEAPQREPRGRWCRTSWLHLGLWHALPVRQSHFPLPGFILLLFFLSLHLRSACFCFSLHNDPSQQGTVRLPLRHWSILTISPPTKPADCSQPAFWIYRWILCNHQNPPRRNPH